MTMDQVQYPLNEVQEEKDLGILVSNDLKPSKQCALAAKKAMSMLGLVIRSRKSMYVTSGFYITVMSDPTLNIVFKCGLRIWLKTSSV